MCEGLNVIVSVAYMQVLVSGDQNAAKCFIDLTDEDVNIAKAFLPLSTITALELLWIE